MEGWIKLHRRMLDWEWYSDSVTKDVFIHLLLTANHCDKKWQGQVIKAGSVITSVDNLARALGFSTQQIRTALKKLQTTGEIVKKSTNKNTTIILCNYADFQECAEAEQQTNNKRITNEQQTNNKRITTNKNVKNEKNVKNIRNNSVFIAPTLEEVKAYAAEKNLSLEAERFIDYYTSNGWKVGRNKMKDWKATVRNWGRKNMQDKKEGVTNEYDKYGAGQTI